MVNLVGILQQWAKRHPDLCYIDFQTIDYVAPPFGEAEFCAAWRILCRCRNKLILMRIGEHSVSDVRGDMVLEAGNPDFFRLLEETLSAIHQREHFQLAQQIREITD